MKMSRRFLPSTGQSRAALHNSAAVVAWDANPAHASLQGALLNDGVPVRRRTLQRTSRRSVLFPDLTSLLRPKPAGFSFRHEMAMKPRQASLGRADSLRPF